MENNNKIDFLLRKGPYIILSILFFAIAILCFGWGRDFLLLSRGIEVDENVLGTFGDFVGGVLGTVFSIMSLLLVIRTFRHQQSVTTQSNAQLEVQRFNNLFFELLHLYQSQVSDLCVINTVGEQSIKYTNKDFFDQQMKAIQTAFRNRKSFEKNQSEALKYYMIFYIENQAKIGAYFRTLYRIYDLIDTSKLEEPQKKEYLKIMRAQLTNSELFFMRYNAVSFYGRNFQKYINKYHILKHLPAFELLEFKDWWGKLKAVERTGLNVLFSYLDERIRDNIDRDIIDMLLPPSYADGRFRLYLTLKKGREIYLKLQIFESIENLSIEYRAFEQFDYKTIQRLLDCFLKEIVYYSNFGQFNSLLDIDTFSNPISTINNVTLIDSGIRNPKGLKLKVADSDFKGC